jgi:hypothetical protein
MAQKYHFYGIDTSYTQFDCEGPDDSRHWSDGLKTRYPPVQNILLRASFGHNAETRHHFCGCDRIVGLRR